jgi:hypothetical protein
MHEDVLPDFGDGSDCRFCPCRRDVEEELKQVHARNRELCIGNTALRDELAALQRRLAHYESNYQPTE